jgi:hypothetical protein
LLNLLTLPIRPDLNPPVRRRTGLPQAARKVKPGDPPPTQSPLRPLASATTSQIQALLLEQLEALALGEAFPAGVALLDFQSPADLAAWLGTNA